MVIQIEPKTTAKKTKKVMEEGLELPTLGADKTGGAEERSILLEGNKDKAALRFCKMNLIRSLPIIECAPFNDWGRSKSEAMKLKENFVAIEQQVTSPTKIFRLLGTRVNPHCRNPKHCGEPDQGTEQVQDQEQCLSPSQK